MCENVNEKWEMTVDDYERIVDELQIIYEANRGAAFCPALNQRLGEIFRYVTCYPTDELLGWLRYTNMWKDELPIWRPLLQVAYTQAKTRNEPQRVKSAFRGLTEYLILKDEK